MQPDAAAAGNPPPAQGAKDTGSSDAPAKTWLDGLSEGNRKHFESKGWKSDGDLEKAATAYVELEKLQGQSVKLPSEDAPAEEWDKVLSKLPATMRPPESPDKYEFKLPEGLPKELPYSDELATKSKEWFHKAGLPAERAQAVHNEFVKYMADQYTAQAQADLKVAAEAINTTHDDLVKEWGPPDSEGFKKKYALANQAIKGLGLVDAFKGSGILLSSEDKAVDGALTQAQIARAFAAIGEKMFGEDTIDGSAGVPEGQNPFKKDAKGNRNVTLISALVKNDPDRAKRLCKEAGEKWSEWAPSNPR